MLSEAQQSEYAEQGFLILRDAIAEEDIQRLERGVANNPPLDGTLDPNAPKYPEPGRYTLATQSPRDPDLAFIIEHDTIVSSVRTILDDDPVLTAYVIYDRTPDGAGLPRPSRLQTVATGGQRDALVVYDRAILRLRRSHWTTVYRAGVASA